MRQYHKNAKANAETWDAEGCLHTGDILYGDSKSKLCYIVDRKQVRRLLTRLIRHTDGHSKELIKVRGFLVAPPELETVLLDAKNRIIDLLSLA